MNNQSLEQPTRNNTCRISLEEADEGSKGSDKRLKKMKLNFNGQSLKAKSPNHSRNLNLSPSSRTQTIERKSTNGSLNKNQTISKSRTNGITGNQHNNFQYKIVKKDKLLIPMTDKINTKNLKLCQKELLPKEKNYFISEKNFKLVLDAINSKEVDIKNLKILLEMANKDLYEQNSKFENYEKFNTIFQNKNKELLKENSKLKLNYDDLMFQINKMNIIFSNVIKYIKYIKSLYPNDKRINAKLLELQLGPLLDIDQDVSQDNSETSKLINSLFSEAYLKTENLCKDYKKKLYDTEHLVDQLYQIDSGNDNLSDVAKDMLATKKRIQELTAQNEKLEQQNTYLRISYQNLYTEIEKNKSNSEQIDLIMNKYKALSQELEAMIKEKDAMVTQIKRLNQEISEYKKELHDKENEFESLKNSYKNTSNIAKDKENIITELKRQIIQLNKKTKMNGSGSSSRNSRNSRSGLMSKNESVAKEDFFNKSSDEILSKSSSKRILASPKEIEKKNIEIQMLKDKINNMQNEDKNMYFEGDNTSVGVNGVQYIGDMFMILYNQSKMIEGLVYNNKV